MFAIKIRDEALNLLRVTQTPLEVCKITSWVRNCIKIGHTTQNKSIGLIQLYQAFFCLNKVVL